MMRLIPFALVDGAVVHPTVSRSDVVKAMAARLVEKDAFRNEGDAIRCLMWRDPLNGHTEFSPYDVMVLVDDARQLAMQEMVAREMGKP
jgi:hypothetical protein